MMKKIQVLLLVLAIVCLAAWIGLRKPYSPSDDLSLVTYTAFDVKGISVAAGEALAQRTRNWSGITATTFNPVSGLLVLSYTNAFTENSLLVKLQANTDTPISKKVFEKPAGPACPVPPSLIAAFPGYLFWAGMLFTGSLVLSLFMLPLQKRLSFG